MKHTIILTAMLALTASIPAAAQTTASDELLHRIAAQAGGTAEVFVGKLPPDLPKVPLPNVPLVGSVHQSIETPVAIDSYQLYYDATADTLKSYGDALTAAGWKHQEFPTGGGGFVSSTGPTSAIYCKEGSPLVTAQVGADPKDLNVSISSSGSANDLVCGKNPLTSFMKAFTNTPLPPLHAPEGVRMSVSPVGVPNGQSAAYIHNGTSAGDLLNSFAAQMRAVGWAWGAVELGKQYANGTFRKLDDKNHPLQCVISISAVDGKPGEYIAFIDVANLDTLSKGSSTLFQH
jgi:hypothetical protein